MMIEKNIDDIGFFTTDDSNPSGDDDVCNILICVIKW